MDTIAASELVDVDSIEFEDGDFKTAASIKDLEKISRQSIEDSEYRKKLIRHLSSVGGAICTKILNRMLAELMTDNVAINYSYKGQRSKLKFESLEFSSIFSACLKHNPFTQKERVHFNIEAGIITWLKKASSRLSKGKCGDPSMANESWE
ncbi:unnamed protein product [Allacma fusca]|uniref:DUF4806 domain-containing protein n=1 Tax=Allacma fusca TaxID=39272 RepID=A0A8J2KJ72_9HEXA|nr:unnamed protein product [Allacma fusca]